LPSAMSQVIRPFSNSGLFFNYYLDNLIQSNAKWNQDEQLQEAFTRIKDLFHRRARRNLTAQGRPGQFHHCPREVRRGPRPAGLPVRADAGDEQAEAAGDKGLPGLAGDRDGDQNRVSVAKTKVQEYSKLQFDELLAILKKNKRKLKDYDPARREPQERLRLEFGILEGRAS
jgi:hypothetical protein